MPQAERNAAFVARVQAAIGVVPDGDAGPATLAAWARWADRVVVPVADSPLGTVTVYRTREQWGADPALPRLGHPVDPVKRTEVFVHHTVTLDGDDTKSTWETWDEIAAHMRRLQKIRPDLGLDVPYSAVVHVTPAGGLVICEGRGYDRTGAHSVGHNTAALGFSWAGDFDGHPPPAPILDKAMTAFGAYLHELRATGFPRLGSRRAVAGGRTVWGHRDIKATACPGEALWKRLVDIPPL